MNPDADGIPVSLSGHMDTVHPVGSFGTPAVHRDDKNMYGPGVMDCKGGIAAAVLAMDALEKCGYTARPIHLILQSDEENSSATSDKRTVEYMCKKAEGSAAFLNLEGSTGNNAVIRRKGIIRYRFTVYGKAMHSAKCAEGANAIAEAAYKIIELEKMKNPDGITCNCGVINGGTAANTVAEECSFITDIRFSTANELEFVKTKVREVADNITVAGCTCDLTQISFRPAMELTGRNTDLLRRMNEIYKDCGLPILEGRHCLSGSDAAYVTENGIPCVDNIGIEGGRIHSLDEFVRMSSLAESAKRIAAVVIGI